MHVFIYIHRQPRNRGPAKTSSTQNWKSAHVFESPVIAVNRLSSHIITAGDWRPNSRATLTLMPSVLWQFSHLFNVWTAIETNKKKNRRWKVVNVRSSTKTGSDQSNSKCCDSLVACLYVAPKIIHKFSYTIVSYWTRLG